MTITAKNNKKSIVKQTIASLLLVSAMVGAPGEANAYDLQPNTIYVNATGGIYKIDLDAASATKVADTNASLSSIQDIAFDGNTLYGINLHWQLLKFEPSQDVTTAVKKAESFSLQFQGLEARDGVLYGAELRALTTLDQATGNPGSPGPGASSYGLGVGERVTDLAFAEDGTLYASVVFPGISNYYLGTVNPATGALNLIGNTGVAAINALTVKDGVIYAMNSSGDLYTINQVSGFATSVATAVLPGVKGMDTSPVNVTDGGSATGDGGESAGGLSLWLFILISITSLLRRIR